MVVNKGEGKAENARGKETFSLSAYLNALPQTWTQEEILFRDNSVSISINADITYPNVDAMPIVSVRPAQFPMEKVTALLDFVAPSGSLLLLNEKDGAIQYTKAQLTSIIQGINEDIASIDNKGLDAAQKEEYLAQLETDLQIFMEQLKTAPDTSANVQLPSYADLANYPYGHYRLLAGNMLPIGTLTFQNEADQPSKGLFSLYINPAATEAYVREAVNSEDEAVKIASGLLQSIGLLDEYTFVSSYDHEMATAYAVDFSRAYKGVACSPLTERKNESEFMPTWEDEQLSVYIPKRCNYISAFRWAGFTLATTELDANAELVAFAQIKDNCINALTAKFAWRPSYLETTAVTIDRISLGYIRTQVKNGGYALIPAWTFEGTITDLMHSKGYDPVNHPNLLDNGVVLILSAVDGSVIYTGGEEWYSEE